MEQAADAFINAWPNLGTREVALCRMWGNHQPDLSRINDGIVIAGLQKMYAFSTRSPLDLLRIASRVKLVVVDEAHQAIASTYREIIEKLANTGTRNALLGLTATPGRTWTDISADEKLSSFFNEKKVTLEIDDWDDPVSYLIEEGYLARPLFRNLSYEQAGEFEDTNFPGPNSVNDYSNKILEYLGRDARRNKIILNEIETLISDGHQRIIVFSSSVRHAEILAAAMAVIGVDAGVVTGGTSTINRRRTIDAFKGQSTRPMVLCNFGVLTTGFDAPKTSAAIIARPTRSLVLFSQMVGRATRGIKAGGNRECTISTVVDTALPGFGNMTEAFTNWEDVWNG